MTEQPTRDQLRALADAATEGPWEVHGSLIGIGRAKPDFGQTWGLRWRQDIEFICAARTAVPQLLDQLDTAEQRIRDLTQEVKDERGAALDTLEQIKARDKRIQAVQDLIDQADTAGDWTVTCSRLQWAIDGTNPYRASETA